MMQEFFNDKEPNTSINPDEAVETVLQCRVQATRKDLHSVSLLLLDVTPLPMLETAGGVVTSLSSVTPPSHQKAQALATDATSSQERSSSFRW